MPKQKTITINDVADLSGVSYQTVSRVINDSPHVADETRERVLEAIAQLGYRPNDAARRLVTGKSKTIGIISFGTSFYGPAQMVISIERALKAKTYGFVFASINDLTLLDIQQAINELERHQIDGIILITPLVDVDLGPIKAISKGRPCVMIDVDSPHLPSVTIDQAYGGKLAVRHLLELGHRQIAEISGPLTWNDALLRHQAWEQTLKNVGLQPGLSLESDWSAKGGYQAAQQLWETDHRLTAVVVGNDQMALGAMAYFREQSLRLPEDISVIGFDDVPEAAYYAPPLTTIRQNFEALGQRSADLILRLIEGGPLSQQTALYPELVLRSSTDRKA